ncbi:hypothetical protein [Paracoccus pacificus]|uniref:Uncharacterized protein n=1 Tax=Paracoccus pacificus TaxID=1463598 RepID=A0ABW4R4L5_9RHOB
MTPTGPVHAQTIRPGIGHNNGPDMAGTGWRRHCWQKARADLLPHLPVEVVRMQVRRAAALGLPYRTYASVRATTGRDLIAFLFSSNGLEVFRDGRPVRHAARLATIAADRHLVTAPGVDPQALAARLDRIATARPLPVFGTSWGRMRADAKAWLRDCRLPGDAVLMVGETDHEREYAGAGGFAAFIPGTQFFQESDVR